MKLFEMPEHKPSHWGNILKLDFDCLQVSRFSTDLKFSSGYVLFCPQRSSDSADLVNARSSSTKVCIERGFNSTLLETRYDESWLRKFNMWIPKWYGPLLSYILISCILLNRLTGTNVFILHLQCDHKLHGELRSTRFIYTYQLIVTLDTERLQNSDHQLFHSIQIWTHKLRDESL